MVRMTKDGITFEALTIQDVKRLQRAGYVKEEPQVVVQPEAPAEPSSPAEETAPEAPVVEEPKVSKRATNKKESK